MGITNDGDNSAAALSPDTSAFANSSTIQYKTHPAPLLGCGTAWRKLQEATGQVAAVLDFPRYFTNARESKETSWILNSSFRYSLKSSSASKSAVTPGLQLAVILKICLRLWEVSSGEESKDDRRIFLTPARFHGDYK